MLTQRLNSKITAIRIKLPPEFQQFSELLYVIDCADPKYTYVNGPNMARLATERGGYVDQPVPGAMVNTQAVDLVRASQADPKPNPMPTKPFVYQPTTSYLP